MCFTSSTLAEQAKRPTLRTLNFSTPKAATQCSHDREHRLVAEAVIEQVPYHPPEHQPAHGVTQPTMPATEPTALRGHRPSG